MLAYTIPLLRACIMFLESAMCVRAGNLPVFVVNNLGEWFSAFYWALFFGWVA